MLIECFARWDAAEDFMSLQPIDVLGGKVLGVDLDIIQEALRMAGEHYVPTVGASGARRVGNTRYFKFGWETTLTQDELSKYILLAKLGRLVDQLDKPYPGAFRGE